MMNLTEFLETQEEIKKLTRERDKFLNDFHGRNGKKIYERLRELFDFETETREKNSRPAFTNMLQHVF